MYVLILIVHVVVCIFLIGVILLQGGRGGLSETLGGGTAQSLFGGQVANVLTKVTAAVAGVFVITCLSLAYLSTMRGRSVMEQMQMLSPDSLPGTLPAGIELPPQAPEAPAAPDASAPPAAESAPAAAEPVPAAPATP